MFADYHLHTSFSDDSQTPMEDMVLQAVALGLDEVCFTEHVDHGVKTVLNCDYAAYFAEAARLQEKYAGQIVIRRGIEFGVQTSTARQFQDDFDRWPFDFVILSNHQVDGKEFWTQEFQAGKTQEEFQTAYYQAILDVMDVYRDYSVLGHLDMIKRYDQCGDYPDEKILPLVEKILRKAISADKGIELNTSCFKYGLKDLTPSRRILELYHDLGGRVLTMGSDSHETEHLADRFGEARAELRRIGFRELCTFRRMEPIFHKL